MRSLLRLVVASCLFAAVAASGQPLATPFVPVAADYSIAGDVNVAQMRAELEAIRSQAFNSIRVAVSWAEVEPTSGAYRFEGLDRMFDVAGEAGLRVILQVDTSLPPAWVLRRYPDGRHVPEGKSTAGIVRACLDHPGVRADAVTFLEASAGHLARHRSWYALDVASDLPRERCVCPSSRRRFSEWRKTAPQGEPETSFVAEKLAADAKTLTEATSARGARPAVDHGATASLPASLVPDPWLMRRAVDRIGMEVPTAQAASAGAGLAFSFDEMRSAAGDNGWWLMDDRLDRAADPRLAAWTAVSRGARAFSLPTSRWSSTIAGVIGRNPALFDPIRPRPSKAAILIVPGARTAMLQIYRALFARNIQTDLLHPDDVRAGAATRYRIIFLPSALPANLDGLLKKYVEAGGQLVAGSGPTSSADRIAAAAEAAGVRPDVRIDAGSGTIETRFLESARTIVLIGLNHGDARQQVTMTFTPDTQEAIWQNLVTGTAVNFVAGPAGPTYTYTFPPHDALVLMIRKDIR